MSKIELTTYINKRMKKQFGKCMNTNIGGVEQITEVNVEPVMYGYDIEVVGTKEGVRVSVKFNVDINVNNPTRLAVYKGLTNNRDKWKN